MFRPRFETQGRDIRFTFDGAAMRARAGDTIAAALLANGVAVFRRSAVSGVSRGPYCMMGVCFECLVVVDGIGNRQACLVPVEDGMTIQTQDGRRNAGP